MTAPSHEEVEELASMMEEGVRQQGRTPTGRLRAYVARAREIERAATRLLEHRWLSAEGLPARVAELAAALGRGK